MVNYNFIMTNHLQVSTEMALKCLLVYHKLYSTVHFNHDLKKIRIMELHLVKVG